MHVERLHEDPWSPRILHKIERDGICHPSNCQAQLCGCIAPCKLGKKRSYMWIMEAGVEANAAALVGFGAIQPLLMATAIPGAGKDHAREALRRLNKHELWRNSDAQRNHVGGEAKGEAMTPARRKKVVEVEELELLTDSEV